jgi:hypothetical protein
MDGQIILTSPGGRKARPYNTLLNCQVGVRFILARTEGAIFPIFVLASFNLGGNLYNDPKPVKMK